MRSRILAGVASAGLVAALGLPGVGAAQPLLQPASRTVAAAPPRFEVVLPTTARQAPVTGRLIIVASKVVPGGRGGGTPPRLLSPNFSGPAIFGVDLEQLRPGQSAVVDQSAIGYPIPMAQLPVGEYDVQARVNVYTQVRRGDGRTLWLHVNDGTVSQSQFGSAEGDMYSAVQRVRIGDGGTIRLSLDSVMG